MKTYHSIPGPKYAPLGEECIAFLKYDGSNIRAEWNPKKGFCKFGSRNHMIDGQHEQFGDAVTLFQDKYASQIEEIIRENYPKLDKATVFCEYFGPSSFAGLHNPNEEKELRLFDVHINRRGILDPKVFLYQFGNLPFVAEEVYRGVLTEKYIEYVRTGPFDEGVVVKGGLGHRSWMIKIKTDAYKEKLKEKYAGNWEAFWE